MMQITAAGNYSAHLEGAPQSRNHAVFFDTLRARPEQWIEIGLAEISGKQDEAKRKNLLAAARQRKMAIETSRQGSSFQVRFLPSLYEQRFAARQREKDRYRNGPWGCWDYIRCSQGSIRRALVEYKDRRPELWLDFSGISTRKYMRVPVRFRSGAINDLGQFCNLKLYEYAENGKHKSLSAERCEELILILIYFGCMDRSIDKGKTWLWWEDTALIRETGQGKAELSDDGHGPY